MNIKNKNGVTITVLVITIIVMLILFGITFTTSTELLRNTQKNKTKTMLYMVKSRAEILLDDYVFETDGKAENEVPTDAELQMLSGEKITDFSEINSLGYIDPPVDNKIIYRSWDESVLKTQGIDTKNLANGDKIIVQYDIENNEVEVASTKGYSKDGVAIHLLSDF